MSHPHNYARAAFFALMAFTGWTISDALLKLVRADGVPQGEIMFVSGLSGMAVIFAIAALRGKIKYLQPRRWRSMLALGVCQCFAFVCWLVALPGLPLANMYVVAFLTPMTVAGMAAVLFKEQLGWKRALAISTGFLGVVIAVDPAALAGNSGSWMAYLAVFGSMAGTATQMLLLRAVSQHEHSESTSFYPRLVTMMVGLVACASTGFVALPPPVFLAVCASGALGGIGWALMSKAYKNAPAAAVAPFHYSQMITGAVLGFLIWHDVPGPWLISGAAVIMASGFYLVRHERRASRMATRIE